MKDQRPKFPYFGSKSLNGFNNGKDSSSGVGGGESLDEHMYRLTQEEREALKEAGIKTQTFYTVQYPDSGEVIAMFKEGQWAYDWKQINCRTGIIEPFEMVIK